jgi:hypothetical protein
MIKRILEMIRGFGFQNAESKHVFGKGMLLQWHTVVSTLKLLLDAFWRTGRIWSLASKGNELVKPESTQIRYISLQNAC